MPKLTDVYLPADRLPSAVTWKPIDTGDEAAIAEQEIDALAEKFNLDTDSLRKLFETIAGDLRPGVGIGATLTPFSRETAARRGAKEFGQVLKGIAAVEQSLGAHFAKFERLRADNSHDPDLANEFWETFRALNQCRWQLFAILHRMAKVAKDPEAVLLIAPNIGRSVSDPRRTHVLHDIFLFWERTGQKTFTTGPINASRQGPLLEFVNDLFARITAPPVRLGKELIIAEHRRFRRGRAEVMSVFKEI